MSENNTMDSASVTSSPEMHDVKISRTRPSVKKKDVNQVNFNINGFVFSVFQKVSNIT